MGSGVFNGAFTTGVGFVPLLWAQMPMFVVFAQVFMMIISLGLLHGFIALPLMLAQWGPPPVTVHHSAGHDEGEGDGHGLAYAHPPQKLFALPELRIREGPFLMAGCAFRMEMTEMSGVEHVSPLQSASPRKPRSPLQ